MAKEWTADQVLQLAPDPASAKAGQGLAVARHWISCATDHALLWGECQGSGSKPYQVRVDFQEPAFKCSCPSRKFPCKHALGLMLLLAGGGVPAGALPAWVTEWVASRAQREQAKASKAESPAPPVDLQAQAKRHAKRLDRIADGSAVFTRSLTSCRAAKVPNCFEMCDASILMRAPSERRGRAPAPRKKIGGRASRQPLLR